MAPTAQRRTAREGTLLFAAFASEIPMHVRRIVAGARPQPLELLPKDLGWRAQRPVAFPNGDEGQHPASVCRHRRQERPTRTKR